jgi:hypothetical protein
MRPDRVGVPDLTSDARAALSAAFPHVRVVGAAEGVALDLGEWAAPGVDLLAFDRLVHHAEDSGAQALVLRGADPVAAGQVLLRYQRLFPPQPGALGPLLTLHRALHDRSKPLVRADHDHALDTWLWVRRLDPAAGLAVQAAALLHDVERLESEADTRVEHLAPDYQVFKDTHAARGAERARALVATAGLGARLADAVGALIAGHERRGEGDAALLADADALSFFCLNSAGYLAWFGPEQTARKVTWTLARMRPAARAHLAAMRLPDGILPTIQSAA